MKIHEFASQGDCTGVRMELEAGVSVDSRDEQNFTPLASAASKPTADESMLILLIESGADVNAMVDESKSYPIGLVDSNVLVVSGGETCNENNGEEQQVEKGDRFSLDLSDMTWKKL